MKATAGQNILLCVVSADRRNFNEYNARQLFLVENVLVTNHKNTIICIIYLGYLQSLPVFYQEKWPMTLMTRMDRNGPKWTTLNKIENRPLNHNLDALFFNITCDRQQMSRL